MVEVDGPFEMLGSETRHFPAGAYYFIATSDLKVAVVRKAASSGGTNSSGALKLERQIEGKVIALSGVSGEPLPTRTSNGPHKYLGVVTFSCHRSLGLSGQMQCVLSVINRIDRRHYVESVVGSETLPNWPAEVLKAQAVLVQTLLARRDPKMPLGDSTQCMLYEGSDYARKETVSAVSAVWNKCLLYKGTPIQVFYHPTCGGRTSSAFAVFGSAAKGFTYLPSVKCDFCKDAPFWKPTVRYVPAAKFATVFGAELPLLKSFDAAKRPGSVSFVRAGKPIEMSGYKFWLFLGQRFGWDKAPGLRFSLAREGNKIAISSTGAGHGVGLCEWGAARQAEQGRKYPEILRYYFPGTELSH